ncbi:MAG: 1-deoxy-D-xylulose-5-phosphate synthase [Candidatus Spyradocola sp.]
MSILQQIQDGASIRSFSMEQLEQLCEEIRREILRVVAVNGGHLSSNLGAVELIVGIHYVYDLPADKLLFDVGHQCYAHKLLTGRADRFDTLRQLDGISGFPKREESEYDAFGAGHSGTAVSAALGYARAAALREEKCSCVALVGDGSFMDGPCMEAVNDAGRSELPLVVVLNDNTMSISRNVGALSNYLNRLRSNKNYWRFKGHTANFLKRIPLIGRKLHDAVYQIKNSIKYLFVKGQFFEALGFTYLGPIDGHDLPGVIRHLTRARNLERPVLLHAVTQKGYGYRPAEEKPDKYHGVAPYVVENDESISRVSYTGVVSSTLCDMARMGEEIAVITAAMPDGTGVAKFGKEFPQRFFDVGIAEEHAVTMAAGLAAGGVTPYFAVYSTFLQRAYDQIVHDVALQKLHVVFLCSHAGLVGEDGATHHGAFDLSYCSHIPNMTILAPSCAEELEMMLCWAQGAQGPVLIRYPKTGCTAMHNLVPLQKGAWQVVSLAHKARAVVFAAGSMVSMAMIAADTLALEGIDIEVVNCRQVKPLPDRMLVKYAHLPIVTLEENAVIGGFGALVAVRYAQLGYTVRLLPVGIEDEFVTHGACAQLLHRCGLDVEGLCGRIKDFIG